MILPEKIKSILQVCYPVAIVCCMLTVVSCDPPNYIFEDNASFTIEKPWLFGDSIVYTFKVKDTNRFYNLLLEIDHNKKYQWENLYVKIDTKYPDQQLKTQELSILMADESGEWYSDCRGKTCTFYLPLQEQALFPQMGEYQIKIQPWMREDTIKDIYRIGFKVERDKKRKS